MSINVILADDHAMFRAGLKSLLERQDDMEVVAEAEDGEKAVRLAQELEPDIVVMDVGMPGLNGIEATRQLQDRAPDCRVIALTVHRDQEVVTRMLGAGARGYLIKDCAFDELVDAVREVAGGEVYVSEIVGGPDVADHLRRAERAETEEDICPLSPREREVLQLLAEGMPSKKIGLELGISVKTVETHRSRLMRKLGIRTVAELTKYAVRQNMTPLEK
jgi:DNA-binding NarL/FixJ family response regulator